MVREEEREREIPHNVLCFKAFFSTLSPSDESIRSQGASRGKARYSSDRLSFPVPKLETEEQLRGRTRQCLGIQDMTQNQPM